MSCCNAVLVAFLPETVSLSFRQAVPVCRSVLFPSRQCIVRKQSRMRPGGAPRVSGRTPASGAARSYLAARWRASAFARRIHAPSTVPQKAIPALDIITLFAEWSEAVHVNRWHFYVCAPVTWGRVSSHVYAYLRK